MSFLSLRDIDELARLQGTILNRSALIDQLLEREKLQGKRDPHGSLGGMTMRSELAGLLDEIKEAARGMAAIVNRDDNGVTEQGYGGRSTADADRDRRRAIRLRGRRAHRW